MKPVKSESGKVRPWANAEDEKIESTDKAIDRLISPFGDDVRVVTYGDDRWVDGKKKPRLWRESETFNQKIKTTNAPIQGRP